MKKLILILALVVVLAVPVFAQFNAGFLDGPHYQGQAVSGYTTVGWYCLDLDTTTFPAHWTVVMGPFSYEPNCNAG